MTDETPEPPRRLTPEQEKARKRRNVAIFWSLIGFILLIFVVTLQRLTSNISAGG
jgi:hypothetical protein